MGCPSGGRLPGNAIGGLLRQRSAPGQGRAAPAKLQPAMTPIDHWLERWRIARARPHIPVGARVLDVGSGDGALFRALAGRIGEGVGIDPDVAPSDVGRYRVVRGWFPHDLPDVGPFGAITMLAVL